MQIIAAHPATRATSPLASIRVGIMTTFCKMALALMCVNCVTALAEEPPLFVVPVFQLQKHTAKLKPSDFSRFQKWILSQHPSPAKKALLTSTITSTYFPFTPTITWYKAKMSTANFETLLKDTYPYPSAIIETVAGNYDYIPDGDFWVDFANASHFGGGFRSRGNVQEERMFDEFPQLPDLAYKLNDNKTILPVTSSGEAEPFLIVRLLRKFDVSNVPYGKKLDNTSPKKVEQAVIRLSAPFKMAHIIGLAAKDYSKKKNPSYSMNDLKYHLQAAYLGDLAACQYNGTIAPVIHTGRWGAGAFKNSLKMLTALQILAAEMAFPGTTNPGYIFFHGIDNSIIDPIQDEILQALQAGQTPVQLLTTFYNRQKTDSSWKP